MNIQDLGKRIDRVKYEIEDNQKIIRSAQEKYKTLLESLDDTSKEFIVANFPLLLSQGYIDNLDKLSYNDLQNFIQSTENLLNKMMASIEESLNAN